MKIRILQHMVGTIVSYQCNDIVDMPDHDARLAIAAGVAVPVDELQLGHAGEGVERALAPS